MNNTQLQLVKAAIRNAIAGITVQAAPPPAPPVALFDAVYALGDKINDTLLHVAVLNFLDQNVSESTNKTACEMPVEIRVAFGFPESQEMTSLLIEQHAAHLLGELQARFAADRRIGNAIEDIAFAGGGSNILPRDETKNPRRFVFNTKWTVRYRFQTTNPTQQL